MPILQKTNRNTLRLVLTCLLLALIIPVCRLLLIKNAEGLKARTPTSAMHEEGIIAVPRKVVHTEHPDPTKHYKEFAPWEDAQCDDELVCPANMLVLCFHAYTPGRKSLMFETLFWLFL
jgi:hypothetical protein